MNVSTCFKDFAELARVKEGEDLLIILKEREKYLAHLPDETLEEHLQLVISYFLKLVKSHQLDIVTNNLILECIPKNFREKIKIGNFIKEVFYKAILYHDFGKINHNFQLKKMKNEKNNFKEVLHSVDSQHSIISTYLFLVHVLDNEHYGFDRHEQALADTLITALAYPIVRHHSKYLNAVTDIDFQENLEHFPEYLSFFDIQPPADLPLLHDIIGDIKTTLKQFNNLQIDTTFPIYALVKLNFSLLTASDYYATGEYMQDLKVDDFGLIEADLRRKIIQNFKTTKDYNIELFDATQKLLTKPFKELQDRNTDNLNSLRQKLAAEALTNLRKYKGSNLFYLEAPTGSGKTNISLAVAIELLSQKPVLNKIFYVFPFTALITQTFDSIKDILKIDNEHIIQLHSKSGFNQKNEDVNDGNYGINRLNFINNHFVNYPITLLTHIKFFDILKGNSKDTNYIFHRLANSIVIIDELQSYNPKHWDKTIYFLSKYANLFNIKIILMSATLPKIGNLLTNKPLAESIVNLVSKENKSQYFQNPNFAGRVNFDFSILDKWNWKKPLSIEARENYLSELKLKVFEESENYACRNQLRANSVRTLIEFITKKSASSFLKLLHEDNRFSGYKSYLISGEILDSRRKQIIDKIKHGKDDKVVLITTQVVEAGVDIDMDLGFKDRSLIDSDEQLAGRVNRNAGKENCKVFMFDFDTETFIYRGDKRLKVDAAGKDKKEKYKLILKSKDFDTDYYDEVQNEITRVNRNEAIQNFSEYLQEFDKFNFKGINEGFKLIEQDNESIFIPLFIPKDHFSFEDQKIIEYFKIPDTMNKEEPCISGKEVWKKYIDVISANQEKKSDYFINQIQLKRIYGILSKFMISAFSNQIEVLREYCEDEIYEQYGIRYMYHWEDVYSYESGVNLKKINDDKVFVFL